MVDIRADNSRIHSTAMHWRRIGMFRMPKERVLSGFWTFLTMEEARICCGNWSFLCLLPCMCVCGFNFLKTDRAKNVFVFNYIKNTQSIHFKIWFDTQKQEKKVWKHLSFPLVGYLFRVSSISSIPIDHSFIVSYYSFGILLIRLSMTLCTQNLHQQPRKYQSPKKYQNLPCKIQVNYLI